MNHDVSAADHGGWIIGIRGVQLVVVHQAATRVVPDPDAKLVAAATTWGAPVDGGEHEAVVTAAVDRARPLVLGLGAGTLNVQRCPGRRNVAAGVSQLSMVVAFG